MGSITINASAMRIRDVNFNPARIMRIDFFATFTSFLYYSHRRRHSHRQAGFTVIEVLFVTAIVAILAMGVFANIRTSRNQFAVDTTAEEALTALQTARTRTLTSQGEELWGVRFGSGTVTVFKGPQYSSNPLSYEARTVANGAVITVTSLAGGGSDVLFDRLVGTTSTTGSIRIEAVNNASFQHTVYVDSSGQASLSPLPSPQNALVTDTRHVHYTLPWDLRTSLVMTLTWTDPPLPSVGVNIVVANFITNNRFLWESDTNVNGSIQHLRIVSHSLAANQTVLAIRRDRDENSKALVVTIDSSVVASYSASGAVTPGAGITYQVQ